MDPASAEAEPVHPQPRLPLLAAAIAGLLAAWGWMQFAQRQFDTIEVGSFAALALIYYFLVYFPIGLIAVILGKVCGVASWRTGSTLAKGAGAGLLYGVAGLLLAAGLARLNGGLVPGESSTPFASGLFALGLILTLFQVAAEELLFRGWLRRTLGQLVGRKGAVAIAALAYAGFEMAGNEFAALPLLNLVLLGLFLGLLADRYGGVAAPLAAHFGWTASEDFLLGLNPNPGAGPFGALRDFDLLGAPLWGGSEAGLAASLAMSAVLIALALPLFARSQAAAATT